MADVGATSATVLYTAAILMLLGVRSWQQYRMPGTPGFNGFRGAKTAAARVAGAGFVFALLTGVVSPALVWLHALPLLWADSGCVTALTVGGGVLALAGVVFAFAAQSTMGASWRIGVDTSERTELVTHGLFTVIRNPIFTARRIGRGRRGTTPGTGSHTRHGSLCPSATAATQTSTTSSPPRRSSR